MGTILLVAFGVALAPIAGFILICGAGAVIAALVGVVYIVKLWVCGVLRIINYPLDRLFGKKGA